MEFRVGDPVRIRKREPKWQNMSPFYSNSMMQNYEGCIEVIREIYDKKSVKLYNTDYKWHIEWLENLKHLTEEEIEHEIFLERIGIRYE